MKFDHATILNGCAQSSFTLTVDFFAYLLELQNAFAYSPSPQEIIELEKFSPALSLSIIVQFLLETSISSRKLCGEAMRVGYFIYSRFQDKGLILY